MVEILRRMHQLLEWQRGKPTMGSVDAAWNTQWETRKPRLIPKNTDGPTCLARFAITRALCDADNSWHPTSLLEVGCGPGSRSMQLFQEFGLDRLFLLDNSSRALIHQVGPLIQDLGIDSQTQRVKGSMLDLPLAANMDIVFAYGPHDHFFGKDRQITFDQMYTATAENGLCIVILPSLFNPFWTAEMITKVLQGSWEHGPTKFFTPQELLDRMQTAGYEDVELFGADFYTSWLRLLPRDQQLKHFDKPTPITSLNAFLQRKDREYTSLLNKFLGGSIMVMGRKR